MRSSVGTSRSVSSGRSPASAGAPPPRLVLSVQPDVQEDPAGRDRGDEEGRRLRDADPEHEQPDHQAEEDRPEGRSDPMVDAGRAQVHEPV